MVFITSYIDTVVQLTVKIVHSFQRTNSYLFRPYALMEALLITDGFINAIKFSIEYIYYKIQNSINIDRRVLQNQGIQSDATDKLRSKLLDNYNSLYKIAVFDRYIFYGTIYLSYLCIDWINSDISTFYYYICLLITIPYIQHKIISIGIIKDRYDKYCENKRIFLCYSISKFLISSIQDLDESIHHIQNYQIFILYKYLDFGLGFRFLKSYVFIYVLYYLRDSDTTYYYYKAVKLAYYYSTGYLFNTLSKGDAIYIINVVINEKRWFDVDKIEIVHAFYNVISYKYNGKNSLKTTLELYFVKFCTLWSIISVLKMFTVPVITFVFIMYLLLAEFVNPVEHKLRRYITCISIYCLLLLHTNDLIISGLFVVNPVVYYFTEEVLFFINNSDDIKKILRFYNKSDKRKLRTSIKRISRDEEYVVVTNQ